MSPDPATEPGMRRDHAAATPGASATLRERVLGMLDGAPRPQFDRLESLVSGEPAAAESLLREAGPLTGLKPSDYDPPSEDLHARLVGRRSALVAAAGADSLLVPQPEALGGFGIEIDGALHNAHTLRNFEAMIALDRALVLDDLRNAAGRPVVWEVGGGLGSFAHAFRTFMPGVSYAISDEPELLLAKATFLGAVFPEASFAVATADEGDEDADFVLLPPPGPESPAPARADLMVSMGAFGTMDRDAVDACVGRAYELGCPWLYSLEPLRRGRRAGPAGVDEVLSWHYWMQAADVLPTPKRKADPEELEPEEPEDAGLPAGEDASSDHRHRIGWRRRRP